MARLRAEYGKVPGARPIAQPLRGQGGCVSIRCQQPCGVQGPIGSHVWTCCDTPAKIAADRARIKRAVGRAVFRFGATSFHVQTRCQAYASVVEEALIQAAPKCHDFTDVSSKEQQVLVHTLVPSVDVEAAHVATIVRPCNTRRWEDSFWMLGR